MMLDGEVFTVQGAVDYIDWGTLRESREYCGHYLTIFCDVDGVLLNNGSKFGKSGWATDVIKDNVQTLAELQKRGFLFLVVTVTVVFFGQQAQQLRPIWFFMYKYREFRPGTHGTRILTRKRRGKTSSGRSEPGEGQNEE